MTGRARRSALDHYHDLLQRVLSCLTHDVVIRQHMSRSGISSVGDQTGMVALNAGNPSRLRTDHSLMLTVMQQFRVMVGATGSDPWRVSIQAYVYALETELPENGSRQELIAYHRHPASVSDVSHPHLHIGQGIVGARARVGARHLPKIHFPTGQVGVEEITTLAIREFGTEPLRDDWESVMQSARDGLRQTVR